MDLNLEQKILLVIYEESKKYIPITSNVISAEKLNIENDKFNIALGRLIDDHKITGVDFPLINGRRGFPVIGEINITDIGNNEIEQLRK